MQVIELYFSIFPVFPAAVSLWPQRILSGNAVEPSYFTLSVLSDLAVVVPGQPLRRIPRQILCVPLQIGQIVEREALRKWLLALKRANLAGLPHQRYSCGMRPLRYSINVTLDGCCDHRVIPPAEDLHRNAIENLNRADALLFGRVTYEMMEAAWRPPGADRSEA